MVLAKYCGKTVKNPGTYSSQELICSCFLTPRVTGTESGKKAHLKTGVVLYGGRSGT
jgi:hypothetical protein